MTYEYKTLADVRQANKEIDHHFFDRNTMHFFGTKIESTLYAGRYFITSEQPPHGPRLFTIREAQPDGQVKTVGDAHGFKFKDDAREAIRALLRGEPIPEHAQAEWTKGLGDNDQHARDTGDIRE